jgi:polyphosphate kinase
MEKYFDRELSALEFNARVLAEGMDPSNPLLERLKFIGIVSSNLDEFYMVRVASLQGSKSRLGPAREKARLLLNQKNTYFMQTIVPELEAAGIVRTPPATCTPSQLEYLRTFFMREVLPVLTPIALGTDRPCPTLANLRIYMTVCLKDPKKAGPSHYAVVEIPHKGFSRLLFLPTEKAYPFVLLEDLIAFYASELFPGYEIVEKGLMRITRGAELTIDEEKDEDFLRVMSEAIRERREGDIVRLELSSTRDSWAEFLQKTLRVAPADVVENQAWFDLKGVSQLAFQPGFEDLKRPAWEPCASPDFERTDDLWSLLREKNELVLHPYESFDVVEAFLNAAADDPDVLAIKQTLYRTDSDSPVLRALERAAEKGKRVTALIELKARFDEENNIEWAQRLIRAGATVLYGVAGYKTHAKACLVVRREREGIRRYVHLGTGNYNARTSRVYSDIGFFTSEEAIANDVSAFFNMITGVSQPSEWNKISVAPYGMRRNLLRLIRREEMRSTAERPGLIRAKMNSLVDAEIIEALYKASNAGVRIQLNVRGICGLRPGVKNMSENIQVISIVDQFLEHSRIFYFENGGESEVYLSSADWMPRNLDRRIEMMFPVDDAFCKKRLIETLDAYFRDTVKSWILLPDGSYARTETAGRRRFRAQEALCQRALEEEHGIYKVAPKELKPQRPVIQEVPSVVVSRGER